MRVSAHLRFGSDGRFDVAVSGPDNGTGEAILDAILGVVPHGGVQRGDGWATAENWGVTVLRMTAQPPGASAVFEYRVDKLAFNHSAIEAACRSVAPALSVSEDLIERPESLFRRVMRRLTINAPPGRWGK